MSLQISPMSLLPELSLAQCVMEALFLGMTMQMWQCLEMTMRHFGRHAVNILTPPAFIFRTIPVPRDTGGAMESSDAKTAGM